LSFVLQSSRQTDNAALGIPLMCNFAQSVVIVAECNDKSVVHLEEIQTVGKIVTIVMVRYLHWTKFHQHEKKVSVILGGTSGPGELIFWCKTLCTCFSCGI
jgi:hypothetical protein